MHSEHKFASFEPREATWVPTIALAWLHFAIALGCAVLAVTSIAPPMLAILGMAIFGVLAVFFVILTVTR